MEKKRLDVLLVERGLAESRAQAQALVMASTFVTRLKVGESLVDAKGVSRLVSRRVGIWPLAVFAATGIIAIVGAVLVSPALRNVIQSTSRAIANGLGL